MYILYILNIRINTLCIYTCIFHMFLQCMISWMFLVPHFSWKCEWNTTTCKESWHLTFQQLQSPTNLQQLEILESKSIQCFFCGMKCTGERGQNLQFSKRSLLCVPYLWHGSCIRLYDTNNVPVHGCIRYGFRMFLVLWFGEPPDLHGFVQSRWSLSDMKAKFEFIYSKVLKYHVLATYFLRQ